MKYLVILMVVKFVVGGYIPPQDLDYGNNMSPSCACDEQMTSITERVSKLELDLDHERARSNGFEKSILQHERSRRQAPSVTIPAFTAYLSHYYNQLGQQDVVVFDKTLTNDGGFYDVTSGKFTAPYAGLYLFSFIIETKHNVDTAVRLVVDGANTLDAVAEPRHQEQNVQGGNVGILRLNKGQQVWVEIYNTNGQSLEGADTYRFTTFTGALLAEVEENVIG